MGLPDFSAVGYWCTHGRHFLSHSDAASELPEGDGTSGAPDQQEVWRGGGLNGQLVLARVQLADEGGLFLGLQWLQIADSPFVMLFTIGSSNQLDVHQELV